MLLTMHIKNIALIEEIDIDFHEQLNILTGETGAGKSIIIGSWESVWAVNSRKNCCGMTQRMDWSSLYFRLISQQSWKRLRSWR